MKRVMKTVVLVMMVAILFGVSASAAVHTSKNVTHRLGKRSSLNSAQNGLKGKRKKSRIIKKKRKAAGGVKSEVEGKVIEQLPNAVFRVELKDGSTVTAFISGKLRMYYVRIHFGDRVLVEISPDQPDRGRIIWRFKQ